MRHAGTRLCAQKLAISPTTCGIPFVAFWISAVIRFTDRRYFSGRAAGSEIACVDSIPYGRESANLRFAAVCDCYVPLGHVLPARGSRFKWGGEAGHNPTLAFYP